MSSGSDIAFLLAGPALSLLSMILINRIMGLKRAVTYIILVVIFSSLAGTIYELIF